MTKPALNFAKLHKQRKVDHQTTIVRDQHIAALEAELKIAITERDAYIRRARDALKEHQASVKSPQVVAVLSALAVCVFLLLVSANGVVIALAMYATGMAAGHATRYFVRWQRSSSARPTGHLSEIPQGDVRRIQVAERATRGSNES